MLILFSVMKRQTTHSKLTMYLLLLYIGCVNGLAQKENIEISRQEMFHYLTDASRYDSVISPKRNEIATKVEIKIVIHGLHTISVTTMDASVDMFLYQIWLDPRLNYTANATDFNQLEVNPKSIELVWHPDVFILNEKQASLHSVTTKNELMHIYKNGTVMFCMRLAMTLTCPMNLDKYPFDSQTCPIIVQSFGYTSDYINLQWKGGNAVVISMVELSEFTVDSKVTYERTNTTYETGTYLCLQANITLHRKVEFFLLYVFAPSILLVTLSWLSFFVDPGAVPARVTIGVTCVLTMVTQSSSLLHVLPPVSYVKSIDVWIFICLVFVFAPLFEYAYVNSVLQNREAPPGRDVQIEAGEDNEPQNDEADRQHLLPDRSARDKAKRMDRICRILYPITLLIVLVVYACCQL